MGLGAGVSGGASERRRRCLQGGSASVLRGYHNSPWCCLSAWTYELVASLGGLSGAWNAMTGHRAVELQHNFNNAGVLVRYVGEDSPTMATRTPRISCCTAR